ncbi:MAG: sugar ABC transporter permease [Clostridia bacterium]|nr:sugar ABC transporter permease [Clostridia bacterium]MBQ9289692.1 sugar ABC transporter permease [Clostridia bacterium]
MSMGNFLYEKVLPLLEYVPYALLIGVCVALLITLIYALVRTAQKKPVARGVRESLWGYFFIFPWVVGICIFFLSGVANSLLYSFYNLKLDNGLQLIPLTAEDANGAQVYAPLANYISVFNKELNYPLTLANFAVSLILQLPVIIAFSLIIALMLNGRIRGRGFFRTIFFLPVIIATGPVMSQLTAQGVSSVPMVSQNVITSVLTGLPEFIATPISDLFSQLILILWNSGIQILIFLAGLQKVPTAMYEAAKIDGASAWETFWKITLPSLRSMILLNSIYTVVTLATNSTNPIIDLIYNATYAVTKGYSYAAAMTWMYTVVVAILLLITFLIVREKKEKKSNDVWRRDVEANKRGMQSKKVQKMLERGKAA